MSKSKKRHGAVDFAIILLFFGALAIVASLLLLPKLVAENPSLALVETICLYAGIGVCAIAVIIIIVCIFLAVKEKRQKASSPEKIPDVDASMDGATTSSGGAVTYVPSQEAQNFIQMGSHQSVDEKFEQIAKMDKTQFVIYVARLFSRKGYQVKLTPVFDNYNIDMLVEKMGVIIAVGCVLTDKILGEGDIQKIAEGKSHYQATNVMALTNMYFDRTALDFAKANKMSLVDRVILTEDFIN